MRWLTCWLAVVGSVGCSNDCEEMCKTLTTCEVYCEEGKPDCDEQRKRDGDLKDCVRQCEDAVEDKGESCEKTISSYGECVDRHSCSLPACSGEEDRYFDECLADTVGSHSCSRVCNQLESGCYPFELFGYRGPDCEDACLAAANDRGCSEALYELDECEVEHSDPMASCLQVDSTCLSNAETFVERCDGFAPTRADPDEKAFCAAAAATICSCDIDLSSDPACELRTTDQCLFELWSRPCRTGWQKYVHCLERLEACDYDSIHDNCQSEAQARLDACYQAALRY